jgi:hypothetical protein
MAFLLFSPRFGRQSLQGVEMNAPSRPSQKRPDVTQTFFPSPRPATVPPATGRPRPFDERKDDDRAPEEPGYGHGV